MRVNSILSLFFQCLYCFVFIICEVIADEQLFLCQQLQQKLSMEKK